MKSLTSLVFDGEGNVVAQYVFSGERWLHAGEPALASDIEALLDAAHQAGDAPVVLACRIHLGLPLGDHPPPRKARKAKEKR